MYNRAAYNKTAYNRILYRFRWKSTAEIVVEADSKSNMGLYGTGTAEAIIEADSYAHLIIYGASIAEIVVDADGAGTSVKYGASIAEIVVEAVSGALTRYVKDVFSLTGINLTAGDELIIDTDAMTVTLNGTTVIDPIDDDAVFFSLKYGANRLVLTSDGPDTATVKVAWKDRWL